jgi:multisubunit Na+/H+ antiporter MnhG subunit
MGLFSGKRASKAKAALRSATMDGAEAKGRATGRRQEKRRAAKAGETATAAKVSGLRGVGVGIVGTLMANQLRASSGKAGLAGVAAGLAFNMLLKRNPVGAVLLGGAVLAHKAYRSSQAAQAKKAGAAPLALPAPAKGRKPVPMGTELSPLHPATA